MKIKIGNLVGSHESGALARFANTGLPFNTSDRLREMLTDIQAHLQKYEADKLTLLDEYVERNEDRSYKLTEQGGASIDPERRKEFDEKVGELLHAEVEIRGEPFKRRHMLSSTVISANDLMILGWLIPAEEWAETVEVKGEK